MNAFGRYEIVRRIGVGGMGEVFFAWAYGVARTRKPVVVKVLRAEMLSEPGAPEMFVEEGRLSLHLNHSNIVHVFDFGKADDRYFMAMEFVDGLHVGELRKKAGGRLAPDLAAFVAMEVCLALDYAHRLKDESGKPLQIVHRDVTPSNILISREGEVKLADFGIARAVGRSQHTQAGQIRGKVRYMSPEAARGEPLDLRADIFSLGAILFELLTGRRAFDAKGGREAILKQIVSGRAPAPSVVMDVHPALDAVVLRATSPKREERFPDSFAMHRAIEEACHDAGLHPSRGGFLEFLRGLESAHAAAEAASWSGAAAPDPAGEAPPMAFAPNPPTITPSAGRGEGTAAVAPPPVGANTVGAGMSAVPARRETRESPTMTPRSKPSSTDGTIPPPIEGPQSTVLPTGVADPVLFTLVVGEMEPAVAGTELPRFEVTREGRRVDIDLVPRAPRPVPAHPPDEFALRTSDILTSPGRPAPVAPAKAADAEATVTPQRRPSPSVRKVAVEASDPGAARASEERTTDRRIDDSERPTADPGDRGELVSEAPTDRGIPSTSPRPAERITGPSGAETLIRASPESEPTRAPSYRTPGTAPTTDPPRPASYRTPATAATPTTDPARPPSYRAPARPERFDDGGVVEAVEGDSHWKVRRSAEPSSPETSAPLFSSRPGGARRSGASVALLAAGLMGILVLGFVVGHGGSATETPTPSPRRTAFVQVTTPPAMTELVVATPALVTPTPKPRITEMATPVETRVALVATVAPTPVPRPSRAVPRPTPQAAPGILVVNTQPWTEFTIGGRSFHTPLQGERLPPGHYVLALHSRFNPKLDRTVEVDVRSGETTRVILDLTRP